MLIWPQDGANPKLRMRFLLRSGLRKFAATPLESGLDSNFRIRAHQIRCETVSNILFYGVLRCRCWVAKSDARLTRRP